VSTLPVSTVPLADLVDFTPRADSFLAEDYATKTRFGPFTVEGAKLSARGYNEYLGKLANRVTGSIGRSFTESGNLKQHPGSELTLQVQRPLVLGLANEYIRTRFFGQEFDPFVEERWRVLMIDMISDQITGNLARALVESLTTVTISQPEVDYRRISEVQSLIVRSSHAIEVAKCVYPKLPVPAHAGGLERLFMEWADADSSVEALVKIHEYKHAFLRRPYLKADGMPAQYSPDFLVRTSDSIYVVETKAQSSLGDANVARKKRAAIQWCEQINALPPDLRGDRDWYYVLLGEQNVKTWLNQGMEASKILAFSKLRRESTGDQLLPGF
jgi:type III restriction enzyme